MVLFEMELQKSPKKKKKIEDDKRDDDNGSNMSRFLCRENNEHFN